MRSMSCTVVLTYTLILAVVAGTACFGGEPRQLEQARGMWQARQYASGLAIAKGISDLDSNPEALQVAAECYKGLKEWPEAIKRFEQILACKRLVFPPQDVKSWIMDCYLANGDPGKAFNYLDKLVAEYPNDAPKFQFLLGRRYQWMQQYGEGAKQFKQALKMPKTDPLAKETATRFICCSLSAMDWDSALAYLPTFAADYPDSVPEILSGQFGRWKFKIPAAIQVIQKAASEARGDDKLKLKIGLADSYAATHDWDKAVSALNSVPKDFQQRSAQWYIVMAKCRRGQSNYQEAVAMLEQAMKLQGGPELKKTLMEYYRDVRDWPNMIATAQALEKELPGDLAEWRINQGWAYLDMKQYEKAAPMFKDLISQFPEQRWIIRGAQVSLAECLYRLGKGDQALADLKEYYKARPDLQVEYELMYAQVMYYGAQDYEKSSAALDKILDDYPGDPLAKDARDFQVRVFASAGRLGDAASVLQSAAADTPAWNTWARKEQLSQAADAYFRAKDYRQAAELYDVLAKDKVSSKDNRAGAMYRLGVCEHELGHVDAALRCLRKVISEFPGTPAASQASGSIYMWTEFGQGKGGNGASSSQ